MEPDLCTRGRSSTMALLLFCVVFLALFLPAHAAAIDLNSACGGELISHTECLFAGHGTYAARRRSVEITLIRFDSLRNSAISLHNLPNVETIEIASKLFDTYEPCEHVKDQIQPVKVKIEKTITVCPPASWSTVETETDATMLSDAPTERQTDATSSRPIDYTTKSPTITVSGSTDDITSQTPTTVKSPDATTSSTENGINLSASLATSTELRALFYQTTLEQPFSATHKTSLIVILLLSSLVLFLIISLIITCHLYIKRRKYLTYMPPDSVELRETSFRTGSNDDNFSLATTSTNTYLEPDKLILAISISLGISFIVILIISLLLCKVMRKCCFRHENISEIERGSSIDLFNLAETSFSKAKTS